MASTKNLKVVARMFGTYNRGAVIPRWCAAAYGNEGIQRLINESILAETDERVNIEVKPPVSVVEGLDSTTALVIEGNDLRKENDRLKTACEGLEAQVKDQLKLIDSYKLTLGDQTAEISRLQGILEEERAKNAPHASSDFVEAFNNGPLPMLDKDGKPIILTPELEASLKKPFAIGPMTSLGSIGHVAAMTDAELEEATRPATQSEPLKPEKPATV